MNEAHNEHFQNEAHNPHFKNEAAPSYPKTGEKVTIEDIWELDKLVGLTFKEQFGMSPREFAEILEG